jgi:hypothetical protein
MNSHNVTFWESSLKPGMMGHFNSHSPQGDASQSTHVKPKFHMCDWCGGPHLTEQCYRKDPRNVHHFPHPAWPGGVAPASVLATYRVPKPRNPHWYRTKTMVLQGSQVVGSLACSTESLIEALSVLQAISDLNGTSTHINPYPPPHSIRPDGNWTCQFCLLNGHRMEKCYARDPENLYLYPHSAWLHGEPPKFMKLKYYKPFTQEEAQQMSVSVRSRTRPPQAAQGVPRTPTPSPGVPLWSPPTVDPTPDLDMEPPVPKTTPIQLQDTAPKVTDWLSGVLWCKPFSG